MAIGKRNVSGSRLNKDAYIAMLALKDYGYDGDYMITSMQRSASENRGVGGVKDSLHTHGNACDFGVKEHIIIELLMWYATYNIIATSMR